MTRLLAALTLAAATALSGQPEARGADPLVFLADMQGRFVAPAAVETAAAAKATGVLVGNEFTVHGSFTGLSSPLRDLEKTPDDPGVHLHRGAAGQTSHYFKGLRVRLNADERSGIFWGAVTLTDEQVRALLSVETYIDIHTLSFKPGEVRDQWRPADPAAAAARLAVLGDAAPMTSSACHSPQPK